MDVRGYHYEYSVLPYVLYVLVLRLFVCLYSYTILALVYLGYAGSTIKTG